MKQRGYILDGAHVLATKRPDAETIKALRAMIRLAKKMKTPRNETTGKAHN